MIQRSNGMPNLKTLVIDRSQEPVEIGLLLLNVSTLEHLSVMEGRFDDEVMEGIAMGRLGPCLQILSCDTLHDAEKMLSMIELWNQNASMVF
ncbi:hypothetical protein AMATHDRAFT_54102 [Amanita thiersii Skay4041]|uniref:Uncharacterized protein n=1 Tax=Amanita thiersii Skay4041 TaxID=703135 RepID=A0A2A9NWA3_9AGAR|nr:hypothetical protein AMATHDRAFT_54102 [Amanita thiersii Skay4041]